MEEYKIQRTRYEGKSVVRHRKAGLEPGDVGYKDWCDIPLTIDRIRFYLEDVIWWGEYNVPVEANGMVYHKQLLDVSISVGGSNSDFTIIEDLDVFDHLMREVEEDSNDD